MDDFRKPEVPCTCTPGVVRFYPCPKNCPKNIHERKLLFPGPGEVYPTEPFGYPRWRFPEPTWCYGS